MSGRSRTGTSNGKIASSGSASWSESPGATLLAWLWLSTTRILPMNAVSSGSVPPRSLLGACEQLNATAPQASDTPSNRVCVFMEPPQPYRCVSSVLRPQHHPPDDRFQWDGTKNATVLRVEPVVTHDDDLPFGDLDGTIVLQRISHRWRKR